jgi:hypothetical protein
MNIDRLLGSRRLTTETPSHATARNARKDVILIL